MHTSDNIVDRTFLERPNNEQGIEAVVFLFLLYNNPLSLFNNKGLQ